MANTRPPMFFLPLSVREPCIGTLIPWEMLPPPPETPTVLASGGAPTTEEFQDVRPGGDLILSVGRYRLLVSSRVLVEASAFFEQLLHPDRFAEGLVQPDAANPPVKALDEADADNFRLLCNILHQRDVGAPASAGQLAALAELYHFYGITRPHLAQLHTWLNSSPIVARCSRADQQKLLRVAFIFREHGLFRRLSHSLALGLTQLEMGWWEVHPMPDTLKDDLLNIRTSIQARVAPLVYAAIDQVRADKKLRPACGTFRVCRMCDLAMPRQQPANTAMFRCLRCRGRSYRVVKCRGARRLDLFMDWMQENRIWPPHRQLAPAVPCSMLKMLSTDTFPFLDSHSCSLSTTVRGLVNNVQQALDEQDGLDVNSYYAH